MKTIFHAFYAETEESLQLAAFFGSVQRPERVQLGRLKQIAAHTNE